jgi:hypothetical protein
LPAASPAAAAANAPKRPPRYLKLDPPATPRSEAELRVQIATRLVQSHPDSTYRERAPDRLLAIPVIEIELNANGSVRGTKVLRQPRQATESVQLAIDAIRRAAPFGDVSRLPRPWKYVEVFLFDDDLRFKPRTLDSD